jgi:hypothetical protein
MGRFEIMSIYYDPEEFGLVIHGVVEEDESYQFKIVVVWKDVYDPVYYWAADSGCSCPSPFEEYYGKQDLNLFHKGNWNAFVEAVENLNVGLSEVDKGDFINKYKKILGDAV